MTVVVLTRLPLPFKQHTQSNADAEKDALKDAEGEMKDLREQGDKNKALALSELLEGVRDAVATPPRMI